MSDAIDRDALVKWVVQRATWVKPAPAIMFGLNLEVAPDQERAAPITMRPFQLHKNASATDREAEARDLVDEFVREAEGCSATMARAQRFSISAHHKEDPEVMPMARTFFVVRPAGDFADAAAHDPRDVVGNLQRLASDALRHQGTNMQHVLDLLVEDLKDRRLNERALERALIEAVQAREKALSEHATREMAAEDAKLVREVKSQAFGMAALWLGEQLKKPADPKPAELPPGLTVDKLVELVATMSPQQRQLFAGMFPVIQSAMPKEARQEFVAALKALQPNGAPRTGEQPS